MLSTITISDTDNDGGEFVCHLLPIVKNGKKRCQVQTYEIPRANEFS